MATLALNDLRISLVNATKDHFLCSDFFSTRGVAGSRNTIYMCTCGRVLTLRRGKACDRARAPQHAPKIHFKCAVIALLKHNYSVPRFLAKNLLNGF